MYNDYAFGATGLIAFVIACWPLRRYPYRDGGDLHQRSHEEAQAEAEGTVKAKFVNVNHFTKPQEGTSTPEWRACMILQRLFVLGFVSFVTLSIWLAPLGGVDEHEVTWRQWLILVVASGGVALVGVFAVHVFWSLILWILIPYVALLHFVPDHEYDNSKYYSIGVAVGVIIIAALLHKLAKCGLDALRCIFCCCIHKRDEVQQYKLVLLEDRLMFTFGYSLAFTIISSYKYVFTRAWQSTLQDPGSAHIDNLWMAGGLYLVILAIQYPYRHEEHYVMKRVGWALCGCGRACCRKSRKGVRYAKTKWNKHQEEKAERKRKAKRDKLRKQAKTAPNGTELAPLTIEDTSSDSE